MSEQGIIVFLISSDKFRRTEPPPLVPFLICMPSSAATGDISHGLLLSLQLMTQGYERNYIKANVVMLDVGGRKPLKYVIGCRFGCYLEKKPERTFLQKT